MSWQCVSIKLQNYHISREVDIVIKNEKEQNMLVKHILYRLNTLDGYQNSAQPVLIKMNH